LPPRPANTVRTKNQKLPKTVATKAVLSRRKKRPLSPHRKDGGVEDRPSSLPSSPPHRRPPPHGRPLPPACRVRAPALHPRIWLSCFGACFRRCDGNSGTFPDCASRAVLVKRIAPVGQIFSFGLGSIGEGAVEAGSRGPDPEFTVIKEETVFKRWGSRLLRCE